MSNTTVPVVNPQFAEGTKAEVAGCKDKLPKGYKGQVKAYNAEASHALLIPKIKDVV